jgi:DNA-binding Lrp family transcriptional regulator
MEKGMEEQAEYITEALEMMGKGYDQEDVIKELPSVVSGFTPAPDVLITKYGFVTALVWGKMWRYCQMRDGVCRSKLETIANQLGMSERTIIRHIEPLVDGGYMLDMTPELRNKPHIYADTGKIRIGISVEAAMTESHPAMTESHREGDRESLEDTNKKQLKKAKLKDSAEKPAIPNEVKIYREVTGKYPNKATYPSVQKIFESVSARLGRPCTSEDLRPFYVEWTFRGFNPVNMNWTSWAVTGIIPPAQGRKQQQNGTALERYIQQMEAAQ